MFACVSVCNLNLKELEKSHLPSANSVSTAGSDTADINHKCMCVLCMHASVRRVFHVAPTSVMVVPTPGVVVLQDLR